MSLGHSFWLEKERQQNVGGGIVDGRYVAAGNGYVEVEIGESGNVVNVPSGGGVFVPGGIVGVQLDGNGRPLGVLDSWGGGSGGGDFEYVGASGSVMRKLDEGLAEAKTELAESAQRVDEALSEVDSAKETVKAALVEVDAAKQGVKDALAGVDAAKQGVDSALAAVDGVRDEASEARIKADEARSLVDTVVGKADKAALDAQDAWNKAVEAESAAKETTEETMKVVQHVSEMAGKAERAEIKASEAVSNVQSMGEHFNTVVSNQMGQISYVVGLVNEKNMVFRSTSDPTSQRGKQPGDVWWKFTRSDFSGPIVGQWTWDGDVWKPSLIDSKIISSLTVDKLSVTGGAKFNTAVVDTLVSDNAFVGKLAASQVLVTDLGNLIEDGNATQGGLLARVDGNSIEYWEDPSGGTWYKVPQYATVNRHTAITLPKKVSLDLDTDYVWDIEMCVLSASAAYDMTMFVGGGTSDDETAFESVQIGDGTKIPGIVDVGKGVAPAKFTASFKPVENELKSIGLIWLAAPRTDCFFRFKLTKDSSVQIKDGQVTANKIASRAVTADKIAANTITGDKIAAYTITGDKVAAYSITGDKVAARSITGDKIAANTITGDKVNARSIAGAVGDFLKVRTDQLIAGGAKITGSLLANDLVGKTITGGTVTMVGSNDDDRVRLHNVSNGNPAISIESREGKAARLLPRLVEYWENGVKIGSQSWRALLAPPFASVLVASGYGFVKGTNPNWTIFSIYGPKASIVMRNGVTQPSGNNHFVAPISGYYRLEAASRARMNDGGGAFGVGIAINGAMSNSAPYDLREFGSGSYVTPKVSEIRYLNAGDRVAAAVHNNQTRALTVDHLFMSMKLEFE
ncbi:hypothetical protein [Schaalia sp. ZJ1691]|uniref:hypothetical protein n=1 Tax=Schaalia sp. ZJ1691 TaxID=2709404 RepID=UPI0013EBFBFC|nr:hypothetical protein [Schaalia sp. ZJ1691]